MADPISIVGDVLAPYAYIGGTSRSIGTIIPDVILEEQHEDDTAITDHPVETGSAISDHAYIVPPRVEMRCGFSNSTAQSEGYVQEIYEKFLALQATREPFDVSTGKRSYTQMLIRSIHVSTDRDSEFALNITIGLRQVRIVGTATATDPNVQTTPEGTQGTTEKGAVQLKETPGAPSFANQSKIDFMKAPSGATTSIGSFNSVSLGATSSVSGGRS